jgi:hypothetical protein
VPQKIRSSLALQPGTDVEFELVLCEPDGVRWREMADGQNRQNGFGSRRLLRFDAIRKFFKVSSPMNSTVEFL